MSPAIQSLEIIKAQILDLVFSPLFRWIRYYYHYPHRFPVLVPRINPGMVVILFGQMILARSPWGWEYFSLISSRYLRQRL